MTVNVTRGERASTDRPEFTRYGVTVTSTGQTIWLDDPSNVVAEIIAK